MNMSEERIGVVGGKGNMGQRYCSILSMIGIDYHIIDIEDKPIGDYTGFIIATPTETHMNLIEEYSKYLVPILCEKPIVKDEFNFHRLKKFSKPECLSMINQYRYLPLYGKTGDTFYCYYNSGKDGLFWDCINIIGLANTNNIFLSNKSPIWSCRLNGIDISKNWMDQAYVDEVLHWLEQRESNYDYVIKSHEKVFKMLANKKEYET